MKKSNSINSKILIEFEKLINCTEEKIRTNTNDKNDSFRLKSYKNAYRIIKKFSTKIKSGNDLLHIHGIGKSIADKINSIIKDRKLKNIDCNDDDLKKSNKSAQIINELTQVVNVGSIKARELVEQYKVKSVKDLIKRHKKGEIELNDKILLGLKYYGKLQTNIPRKEMKLYEETILSNISDDYIAMICGSYRRKKSSSNDIDVLITHKNFRIKQKKPYPFTQSNEKYYEVKRNRYGLSYIVKMLTESKLLLDTISLGKYKYMGFFKLNKYPVRRIDIRFVPYDSFPTAMLYFTGSMELNQKMRKIAKANNMKLSEYGIYHNGKMINVKDEKDVFDILKIPYLPPFER